MPELDVTELESSVVSSMRLGFATLTRAGAQVVLQTAEGPWHRFRTAALERPHGRGVNLQLEVENVTEIRDGG